MDHTVLPLGPGRYDIEITAFPSRYIVEVTHFGGEDLFVHVFGLTDAPPQVLGSDQIIYSVGYWLVDLATSPGAIAADAVRSIRLTRAV